MKTFPLNDDWTVEYFNPDVDGFEMAPSEQAVPRLPEWSCSGRFAQAGFYAWLQRKFEIEMVPYCVRYLIQIEQAPPSTKLYVNDQHLGDWDGETLRLDITDYVSLGTNRLSLRIDCGPDGDSRFDAVVLLQQRCDES